MAEEEIILDVEQQPPKLPQQKQQQQQQQIKADDKEKKGKPILSDDDKELFRTFKEKYGFEWEDERAGFAKTRVDDDIIFIRRIPNKKKGYAKYGKNGQYLIVKTNIENFKKFKDKEAGMADDDEKIDDIEFEYFNFSKDYFDKNEKLFADSLKQKKFLFNNLGKEKKEEEKEVKYFGWNEFKNFDIIPNISDEKKYIEKLKKFDVEKIKKNKFDKEGFIEEKDLFKIDNDIDNSDSEGMIDTEENDIPEINTQELKQQQEQQQQEQQLQEQQEQEQQEQEQQQQEQQQQERQRLIAQVNQLIAGHTPNGKELRALIKYNNNSDSLLKLIVGVSENNKGEVDFKEIGEIQDLNGDITNLYSDMQKLKTKINSSKNAEEKERLLIKYNKKRLKLEDLVKKYSKEAYRLSTLKKKKATMATHKYLMNKLNKLN